VTPLAPFGISRLVTLIFVNVCLRIPILIGPIRSSRANLSGRLDTIGVRDASHPLSMGIERSSSGPRSLNVSMPSSRTVSPSSRKEHRNG
jgi:hypothetical protein